MIQAGSAMNYSTDFKSVRGAVSPAEWQTRVDLAACYRLMDCYAMTDLIYNHITARIPGTDHLLINLYGLLYREITASSLVKIDLGGNKLDDSAFPINPAGFVIHSAVHAGRADVGCVLHTHSLNGTAVSAQKDGVLPISQYSIFVLASLGYHDYEGVALRDDEKPRLVQDLGDKTFLMLRNHGLLTVGTTVAEAFLAMYVFETVCTIQVRAQAGGGALIPVHKEIIVGARQQAAQSTGGLGASLSWPGLLRRLDRTLPGYDS